jgi:hypothetical protein
MPAQHVSDRLVLYVVTEICERSGDAVVAQAGVLTRHLDYQPLYFRVNPWPPG